MLRGGNKYFGFVLFIIFVIGINLALVRQVYCYDTNVAHPGIADLAVKLYNKNNTEKISAEQMAWIKQGSIDEDTPTRWVNHFYDPVYDRGLWFLGQHDSAKVWSKDSSEQQWFSAGDNSWQRAINDFQANKYEQAYKELGHNIHLVSDMLVPAHTRDSIHVIPPDSYEQYVKNNWDTVKPDVKVINNQYATKTSLEDIFDEAAKYSNNNFYSDSTIEDRKYKIIDTKTEIVNADGKDVTLYKTADNNQNLFFDRNVYGWQDVLNGNVKKDITVKNSLVLSSYASHLLPKAVGYSANTIKLFLDETKKNQKEKVPFFRIGLGGVLNSGVGALVSAGEKLLSSAQSQTPTDQIAALPIQVDVNSVLNNLAPENSKPVAPASPVISLVPTTNTISSEISLAPVQQTPLSSTSNTQSNNPSQNKIITTNPVNYGGGGTVQEILSTSTVEEIVTSTTSTPEISTSSDPIATSTFENTTTTVDVTSTLEITTTTTSTPSEPTPDIVINEIAWAGTSQFTPEDQYVELYNNTDQDINIFPKNEYDKWWKLKVDGQEIAIYKVLNSVIPAHGYYLFEAPDDRTANEIDADVLYFGTFKNSGQDIQLVDNNNQLVDEVDNSNGWFAGSAENYTSMEKINSRTSGNKKSNWQSNQGPRLTGKVDGGGDNIPLYGSPKQSNVGSIILKATQTEIERTLKKSDYPYLLTFYEIPAGKTLNIEPGIVIKTVYPESKIDIKGTLNINGDLNNKITITSDTTQPKSWQGLMFHPGSTGKISNTDISYAGKSFRLPDAGMWDASVSKAIYSDGANLTINGTNFTDNGDTDIYAKNSTLNISNTNFKNGITAIEHYDGSLSLDNLTIDNFSNPTGAIYVKNIWPQLNKINFTNNANGGVDVVSAIINSAVEIGAELPVNLENTTIENGGSLTVGKGTIFHLPDSSSIFVKGMLNLNGTDSEPIKITGPSGDNQYFGHLVFDGGTGHLTSVNFLKGGYNYPGDAYHGVISLNNNANVTMENCRLMDNRPPVEIIQINNSTLNLNNSSLGYTTKDAFFPTIKGIQINSGTLSLNNSNFYDLTTGIYAGAVEPLPQLNLSNMDTRNFINVDNYWDPIGWLPAFNVSP